MQYIEKQITRKALEALSADGYEFWISYERGYDQEDQERWTADVDTAMKDVGACDEEHVMIRKSGEEGKASSWIWLILGNGEDLITDYTTDLESSLAKVFDWMEAEGIH